MDTEQKATEYATGMMGLGEYSEKWDWADKVVFNDLKRAFIAGAQLSNSGVQTCQCEERDMGNSVDENGLKYCLHCGNDIAQLNSGVQTEERVQDASALRWVKASERLPESDGKYICKKSPVSNNDIYVSEAFFNSGKFQSAHYITEWLEEYRQAQPVQAGQWEIDFGPHIRAVLHFNGKGLTVQSVLDGWGNDVPLDQVNATPHCIKKQREANKNQTP